MDIRIDKAVKEHLIKKQKDAIFIDFHQSTC